MDDDPEDEDSDEGVEQDIGGLLMAVPDLPTDEFGWPYQVLFYLDEDDRVTGLVYDDEGHVLAYQNTAEGSPLVDELTWQRAPDPVAAAAVEWWEEERKRS